MLPGERGIIPQRPDYFLAHRPLQPKREVADYVESEGILVPQRFSGLREALASGKPFVVRSEHPQDYDGASGVFSSLLVSPERIAQAAENLAPGRDPRTYARLVLNIQDLTQRELEQGLTGISRGNVEKYCGYARIPIDSFMRQVSYSYWEAIPGLNRAVVADSAIKARYHILTVDDNVQQNPAMPGKEDNYMIVENGEIIAGTPQDLAEDTPENIKALIRAFEAVKNLERFSPDNCPIMEFQSNGERQYFLQYLRGVDFDPAKFSLDRPSEQGEIESVIVRGSTPLKGIETDVIYFDYSPELEVPEEVPASITVFNGPMFCEALVRGSKIQIARTTGDPVSFFREGQGHRSRSLLFKPGMSAVFINRDLMSLLRRHGDFSEVDDRPGSNIFRVRIISDGRKAYLKRIG